MKKSLIALAVAGVVAAPAAFAASANVDFYGKFRVSLDHLDNGIGWQMSDQVSRVGFKGAEDLGGGLKAIYQLETGFNIGANSNAVYSFSNSAGGLGSQRNTFVGLAGDFGTVLAGRHDTPYKMAGSADLFGDTLADAQNTGMLCIICEDLRVNNAVAYVSPSFSGLTVAAAIVTGNGLGDTNDLSDAYSLAAMYGNGPLSLSAGYENLDKYGAKQYAWKLNGSYTIDSLKLGATYEQLKKIGGISDAKSNNYLISAAYGMGPITLAAQYGKRNPNDAAGNNDLTDTTLGVVYSMSKRTSTYLGYAHYKWNATGDKLNAWTLGLNHDF